MKAMHTSENKKNIIDCLQNLTVNEQNNIEGLFVFPPDFPAFEGHFPDQPILPAVIQLAAVRLLAVKKTGMELLPTGVQRAKFKKTIQPDMPITVSILIKDGTDDIIPIPFTISTEGGTAAVGEIQCRRYDE